MLKLLIGQKILNNYKIYFLSIFETKKKIVNDYTIEKYKRKFDYFQKNNTWYHHCESSNSVKHYNLFRPPILNLWLNCFYSNLSKCGIRVNEAQ